MKWLHDYNVELVNRNGHHDQEDRHDQKHHHDQEDQLISRILHSRAKKLKKRKHLLKLLSFLFISEDHQSIFSHLQEQKEKSRKHRLSSKSIFSSGFLLFVKVPTIKNILLPRESFTFSFRWFGTNLTKIDTADTIVVPLVGTKTSSSKCHILHVSTCQMHSFLHWSYITIKSCIGAS